MARNEDFLSRPRPWQRSAQVGQCPVAEWERKWIESSMLWFAGEFGVEAARRPIALPTADSFPAAYAGTPSQIDELVARVCEVMAVDPLTITVELFDGSAESQRAVTARRSHTVGHYRRREAQSVIALDRGEAADPAHLAAIIAHELGHARLVGEGRADHRAEMHEPLTDLLTVFLGMGVFTANAALHFTRTAHGWSAEPLGDISEQMLIGSGHGGYGMLGYMKEPAFGYALACLCGLRRETDPPWAARLDPGPRAQLKQGLEYFAHLAARQR